MSGKDLEPVGGGHHLKDTAVCITLHPLSPPACRQVATIRGHPAAGYTHAHSVLQHTSTAIALLADCLWHFVLAALQQSIIETHLLCYHTCEQGLEADTQAWHHSQNGRHRTGLGKRQAG